MTKNTRGPRVILQALSVVTGETVSLGFVLDYMPGLTYTADRSKAAQFTARQAQMVIDVCSKTPAYAGVLLEVVRVS